MDWALDDKDFSEKYEKARAKQAEYWADNIVDISDTAFDKDSAAAARIRIDARKWVACKLLPRKYGDKPAEINNNLQFHNHLHLTEDFMRRLQDRRQQLLERTVA